MENKLIDANEASRLCGLSKAPTISNWFTKDGYCGFRVLNRTLRFDPVGHPMALVRELPVDSSANEWKG